jgi:hypothetical protein
VRVEVVPEQQRGVGVGGLEEARPAVVEQVALVDRLDAQGMPLDPERREDRLPLGLGAQRVRPQPALLGGLPRDRLPQVGGYSQPASSFVQ